MRITRPRGARALALTVSAATLAAATGLVVTGLTASAATTGADPADIAIGKTATASSAESPDLVGTKAIDGDLGTRWSSAFSDDQWLEVDLGSTATIDHVTLDWEAAYGKAFQVQTSNDNTTWTTVATVTNGTGGDETVAAAGSGRYVRLNLTQRGTGYGYSLYEFQIFGSGGSDPAAYNPKPLPPAPPGADTVVTHHEFQANCTVNHTAPDDPILFPGQFGASHNHSFMGNLSTNAQSTPESLLAASGTSCTIPQDKSAYWFPTLYKGDTQIISPDLQTIYYKSGILDYKKVQPFPAGLKFIVGNAMATADQFKNSPGTVEGFECGDSSFNWTIPAYCAPGSQLNVRYQAPSCWDGIHLDSADHKSHMAYPVNGECPPDHPVPVPMIEMKISWPVSGDMSQVHLANMTVNGMVMSASWHYDFMNGWDQDVLTALTQHCIDGGLQCNPHGFDQYKPWAGGVLDDNNQLIS
jgi:hypothetical protein